MTPSDTSPMPQLVFLYMINEAESASHRINWSDEASTFDEPSAPQLQHRGNNTDQ